VRKVITQELTSGCHVWEENAMKVHNPMLAVLASKGWQIAAYADYAD
jgi:hypothetical protein